jgi:hypothetical protein
MVVGGIVSGYLFSINSAQKAALSLAATAKAMERLEETRSAKWFVSNWSPTDELVATNFPAESVTLDISGSGSGTIPATIQTEISDISASPPVRRIRVDCIWNFRGADITNTLETCRAADQ